jgi:DNA polymerase III alpha subunit (gram-positive type)
MVAKALDVDADQQHRAMSDVEMTSAVFVKLLDIAKEQKVADIRRFVCR